MSNFVEINLDSLALSIEELAKVRMRASDLRPIATAVAIAITGYTDNVFAKSPSTVTGGTAANGFQWKQLSDAYLKARNGRRSNGQLLRDTGKLLQSLQPRGAGNVFESGNNFVEYGTNLPQGFTNRDRPFLAHTDELTEAIAAVIENWILTGES